MNSCIGSISIRNINLEVHILPNILDIGKKVNRKTPRFLINSGNEYMVGPQLPYFPRGGLPRVNNVVGGPGSWQFTSNWGGMSAGDNMVYPVQAVDNVTCDLRQWIQDNVPVAHIDKVRDSQMDHQGRSRRFHLNNGQVRCITGEAVWSPMLGKPSIETK